MPEISIVIATRDRPPLLARCLDSILAQKTARAFEVIVVNDGKPLPSLPQLDDLRIIELASPTRGAGPATARNHGVAHARASLILFTDDDAVPSPGWVDAAAAAFEAHSGAVGVEGPVQTPAFDPLREHSIQNTRPGGYYTCNVAYRREDFLAVGGFDVDFPNPHCEDVDLGRRIARRGTVVFSDDMEVIHPPRAIGFFEYVRRARMIESEWRLYTKHPELRPRRWPTRWAPLMQMAARWRRSVVEPSLIRGSPGRAVRVWAIALLQLAVALYSTLMRWDSSLKGAA